MAILAGMWFQQMHPEWQHALEGFRDHIDALETRFARLPNLVPPAHLVFSAFEHDPSAIRVVILGQDPYPTDGFAMGHAFAISEDAGVAEGSGTKLPASLRNIFTELIADIGGLPPAPSLEHWRNQGVLLLNRHLTAEVGNPGAHFGAGWDEITAAVLGYLVRRGTPLVLVLWGAQAQSVKKVLGLLPANVALVESAHPSPLSAYRGFFGSKPFSKVNQLLSSMGSKPIDWSV
jgi:uracil-DNA glycosylase